MFDSFIVSSSKPTISVRRSWNLEPGTYYLNAKTSSSQRVPTMSIGYKILPQLDNNTIETAVPLTEKVWQDVWQKGYFSIGEHKAGEVVQIQRDEGGNESKTIFMSMMLTENTWKIPTMPVSASRFPQTESTILMYLRLQNSLKMNPHAQRASGTIPIMTRSEQRKA